MDKNNKRKNLTFGEKKEICEWKNNYPSETLENIAKKFEVSKSLVSSVLKNKEIWLSKNESLSNQKRERRGKFPEVEAALYLWMQHALSSNIVISGDILKSKGLQFATKLQKEGFSGSDGWLAKFKNRHHIKQYFKSGEANSAPLETLENERELLKEVIQDYESCDVYNVDETALYWNLEPSKTLSDHFISGTKKSKDRVTIVLTCNADGSDKLTPLFIHKWQTPRVLRGVKKDDLPVWYFWNKTAWMQASIWKQYLFKLNQIMRKEKKSILLLADNAPTHLLNEDVPLSNIKVHFLPPNTTAHLQPLDAGIINSFKAQYRKILVSNRIDAYDQAQENNSEISPIDILDAITFTNRAWKSVKSSTIRNCWRKTNILPDEQDSDQDTIMGDVDDVTEIDDVTSELQEYINRLDLENSLSAETFIHIDDEVLIEELTDDQIVEAVSQETLVETNDPEEEEKEVAVISNMEALDSIEKIIKYCKNPPDNFNIKMEELRAFNSMKEKIKRLNRESEQQVTLDSFINM